MTAGAGRAYPPGVSTSRFSSDLFAGAVRARFRLSQQGQAIVDALTAVLGASVMLHDSERRTQHIAKSGGGWVSLPTTAKDEPQLCYVQARINDRWTLFVCSPRRLHPDAELMAKWAAAKLELPVPHKTADEPAVPPSGGGGGSAGGAEIGIPVWWARKISN
jgi:hypothetical protein